MGRRQKGNYEKHVYWLSETEEARLRQELRACDVGIRSAKGIVCSPLDEINKITSVAPHVWGETCRRAGSWYRASEKNGLYLVVSSFELDDWGHRKAARITRTAFKPPRLVTETEKRKLAGDLAFRKIVPPEWGEVEDMEKRVYLRWARRFGSQIGDFDSLFLIHTANHANFVRPRLYVREKNQVIPYSIDRTAHLCSSCVELFQVQGTRHPRKLVAPCPGAAIFARLKPEQYLLVEDGAPVGAKSTA